MTTIDSGLKQTLLSYQRTEITEHNIYLRLAKFIKPEENAAILRQIAADELGHYQRWKVMTGEDVAPNWLLVNWYSTLGRVLGITFAIKLMEQGEEAAGLNYATLRGIVPDIERFIRDEDMHEQKLIGMLDEELLRYAGSVVLGLNDALVELTGALAGLTLALQDTQLIALSGSITGIAASLSMAASEYLSTKSEKTTKQPLKSATYTGIAYVITVLALIFPYLVFDNYYVCLAWSLTTAVIIIALFNYYISVAKDEPFKRRFLEMAGLSLSVAALSFLVGYLLRGVLGIEV